MGGNKKLFRVSPEKLVAIIRAADMEDKMPEGTVIEGMRWDWERDRLIIKARHPSFPKTPEGSCYHEDDLFYGDEGESDGRLKVETEWQTGEIWVEKG